MKKLAVIALVVIVFALLIFQGRPPLVAQAGPLNAADRISPPSDILESSGKLTYLRVHDVGTGYGGPSDFLDGEVVIKLDSEPDKAFGFQLRNDDNRAVRQGMLDLLRDAFNNNWTVIVDYDMEPGKSMGIIIRVALVK
jgi:hypothetical protein